MHTSFQDGNVEGPIVPTTPVFSMDFEVNDGLSVRVLHNRFGKSVPFMSVFQYVSRYSDRLDAASSSKCAFLALNL